MDSIIEPAISETVDEYHKWAMALWKGEEPDIESLKDRMVKVLTVSMMAGMSTVKDEDEVLEVDKHSDRVNPVFKEAVEALAKKAPTLRIMSPKGLSERLRQTAWYVSGVLSASILERIRARLVEARVNGHSRDWFTQMIYDDAQTSAAHIETVFRTNSASAAAAGRWQQYTDPDVSDLFFGYRYVSQGDHRSRPLHKAMNGFAATKDDPIWKLIWVPNGYNCRCKVRPVRKKDAISIGLVDAEGRPLNRRVFANELQRKIVAAAEDGVTIGIEGKPSRFPDEGFRGNAMMDLA